MDELLDYWDPRYNQEYSIENHEGEKLTASQQAKAKGLSSLRQMAELTEVKERTLINWHKDRPILFRVVLAGLVTELGLVT